MPQTPNRFYDQLARLWTDASGVAHGVRREAGTLFRSQAERFIADMDLVKREDFDAVRELAATTRAENDRLHARIAALEDRLAAMPGAVPQTPVPPVPPAGPRRKVAAPSAPIPPAASAPAEESAKPKAARPRPRPAAQDAATPAPGMPDDTSA